MVTRKSIVAAAILSLVLSFFAVGQASAATRRCSFELFDYRIEASKVLVKAQRWFTSDLFSFNSAFLGADSASEINSDYNAAARDLGNDFGDALIDLRTIRHDALAEFRSGACTQASSTRRAIEVAFYNKTELQLDALYAQTLHTLTRNLRIALDNCC